MSSQPPIDCGYCTRKRKARGTFTWCKRHEPKPSSIRREIYYSQAALDAAVAQARREERKEVLLDIKSLFHDDWVDDKVRTVAGIAIYIDASLSAIAKQEQEESEGEER